MTQRILSTEEQSSSTTGDVSLTFNVDQITGLGLPQTSRYLFGQSTSVTSYIKKATTATSLVAVRSASPIRLPTARDRLVSVMDETESISPINKLSGSTSTTFTSNFTSISTPMADVSREIAQLECTTEEWNAAGGQVSLQLAITHAQTWLIDLYQDAQSVGLWIKPHITADAMGNIVFEWWNGPRKLTVYVSPDTTEYVKVWGPNIFTEMEDGEITSPDDRRELWQWLIG
jgi:hypothetical protein